MNGLEAAPAEGPNEEAQGLSRKRVANAVRKVVSKVLPGEEPGNAKEPPGRGAKSPEHPARGKKGEKAASSPKPPPPPPPPPPAPPKPEAKKEAAKDELSLGLRSLMSKGRGKDHKSRSKQPPGKGEKAPNQEPAPSGKSGSPDMVDSPKKAGSPSPAQELAEPNLASPKLTPSGEQQAKSPASDVQQEVPECATNLLCPSLLLLEGLAPSWWLPHSWRNLA
ncbi:formin-like protein 16 [Rattus rattus]|uniref:formin-like protein 16 n=1 Tax=Rattus rattus TaxID=10117 RepID=UPI0013F2FFB3|nr:formin-like protein 16 [Rattus rattus]